MQRKKQYFLNSVLARDQIDNLYTQPISNELRNEIFEVRAEVGKNNEPHFLAPQELRFGSSGRSFLSLPFPRLVMCYVGLLL